MALVSPSESLATELPVGRLEGGAVPTIESAQHPILWYAGSSPNPFTDTFFRHGTFVLDNTTPPPPIVAPPGTPEKGTC